MKYTINELKKAVFHKVYDVYEVFQNFFGEEYTDLQFPGFQDAFICPSNVDIESLPDTDLTEAEYNEAVDFASRYRANILVWWPEVTVTNEHNKYVIIQDLYAKITVNIDGTIPYENRGFLLNRATYTPEQWASNYMHSHISGIPKHDFESFQNPCLGRGPINGTILSLKYNYDEAEWMLFCQELAMYVTVESLAGIPYNYLERIGAGSMLSAHKDFITPNDYKSVAEFKRLFGADVLKDFILYYLKNGHLSIGYSHGIFEVSMHYYEFIIDISNSFIDFFNHEYHTDRDKIDALFISKILEQVLVKNRTFYDAISGTVAPSTYRNFIGRKVCEFKGQDITLNIIDDTEREATITTLLSQSFAMYVLKKILNSINLNYNDRKDANSLARAGQKICYI